MSDLNTIEDLKKTIENYYVNPLMEFRTQTRDIDTNHYRHIQQFEHIMQALFFTEGEPFSGPAATALSDLSTKYIQTESDLSGYYISPTESLSQMLFDAARVCEQTAERIKQDLTAMPNDDPEGEMTAMFKLFLSLGAAGISGGVVSPIGIVSAAYSWEDAQHAAGAYAKQNTELQDISLAEEQWETDMLNVAKESEPQLPSDANDPSKVVPFFPPAKPTVTSPDPKDKPTSPTRDAAQEAGKNTP